MEQIFDSYERLFDQGIVSKESLFEFGLTETIYVSNEVATEEWELLKARIRNGAEIFIRGFGRDAAGTRLFQRFYSLLLGDHKIRKDPTNNAVPTKLLRLWTGYSKTGGKEFKPIRNYQVSHVFGKTKNVYCFTAPWNIAYVPKIVDPLTGHEARGSYVEEYKMRFRQSAFDRYESMIEDFNSIVSDAEFLSKLDYAYNYLLSNEGLSALDAKRLTDAIRLEFSPIVRSALCS